jgi:hypothetical protein
MRKTDFFIVGAPKSGTSALYTYLKAHPEVYLPKKEIYYFCSDLTFRTPAIPEDTYLSYYTKVTTEKAVGDASVYYLLSNKAATRIKEFNSQAKIIIMLRNPLDMVYSLHSQLLSNGDETIENFEDALAAEKSRVIGERVPSFHKCPREAFYYSQVAKYYEQVKQYKEVFDEQHLHIMFFDDFKKNAKEEYHKVLDFLQIERALPESFETVNPNKVSRNKAFLKFLVNPPNIIKKAGKIILPHHSARREWVIDKLWGMNTKYIARKPMSLETRIKLKGIYKEDIERLQSLINKDLSSWLNS